MTDDILQKLRTAQQGFLDVHDAADGARISAMTINVGETSAEYLTRIRDATVAVMTQFMQDITQIRLATERTIELIEHAIPS